MAQTLGWSAQTSGKSTCLFTNTAKLSRERSYIGFFPSGRFYQVGQKRHDRGPRVRSVLISGRFSNFSTKKKPPGALD